MSRIAEPARATAGPLAEATTRSGGAIETWIVPVEASQLFVLSSSNTTLPLSVFTRMHSRGQAGRERRRDGAGIAGAGEQDVVMSLIAQRVAVVES